MSETGGSAALPQDLLAGQCPRLLDEWQWAPALWDSVRRAAAKGLSPGRYILAGPDPAGIRGTGGGVSDGIGHIRMGTMSLHESGDSVGHVSLGGLFGGQGEVGGYSDRMLSDISAMLVRGGWPGIIGKPDASAAQFVKGYCRRIIRDGAAFPDAPGRDPDKTRAVLVSLSTRTATPASRAEVLADAAASGQNMHANTLDGYIRDLRRMCVVENLDAWIPELRTKSVVRTSPTRHLTDPSLAAAMLGKDADGLIEDLKTFGSLFESMVVRDLRAYATALGGSVLHYRDGDGLEADAVIRLGDGRWAAFEADLGTTKGIDGGARSLLTLKKRVDDDVRSKMAFCAVITAGRVAYTRRDGVHVIPLTCLRP
ncbi:MAG: DUF4143 domain-containing protein [Thermoplasmata archaeon]|nr:DUF4143 domain-containing protein [Thermoplasmata archaeon]